MNITSSTATTSFYPPLLNAQSKNLPVVDKGVESAGQTSTPKAPPLFIGSYSPERLKELKKYKRECDELLSLSALTSDKDILKKAFLTLDPALKEKLTKVIWIDHKMPREWEYGRKVIEKDPGFLLRPSLPLIFCQGKNLLEQAKFLFEKEIALERARGQALASPDFFKTFQKEKSLLQNMQRETFLSMLRHSSTNHSQLKKLFKSLPEEVRANLPPPPYYGKGVHSFLYNDLGAHLKEDGVQFRLMAPQAKSVAVAYLNEKGEITHTYPMKKMDETHWEFKDKKGRLHQKYVYLVESLDGARTQKLDPFGTSTKYVENSEGKKWPVSEVYSERGYQWKDRDWLMKRAEMKDKNSPINIYEVHPLTWKHEGGKPLNYRELAHELVDYCKDMGYTHVELMGLLQHPAEVSMGYQVTGYFAPDPRLGTPDDFKYLVDTLHQSNLGVVLDWVPAHFANDSFGLKQFDGSPLFESSDPKVSNSEWGSINFDFSKEATRDFLTSSAQYWLDKMHIDGLRLDAVSSLLSHTKNPSYPTQNHKGENVDLEGKSFIKNLNKIAHDSFPGVKTFAEESSGFPNATKPLKEQGLGFDMKWNMGWMNHALRYFQRPLEERGQGLGEMIEAITCDPFESGTLALSHDEVSQGKKSLLNKMPGESHEEKVQNVKLLLSMMMALPGKKLNFMGNEFAQDDEWSWRLLNGESVPWEELANDPSRQGLHRMVKALNHLYLKEPALWQKDRGSQDLTWIHQDRENGVISYERHGKKDGLMAVHNFSNRSFNEYEIDLNDSSLKSLKEIFNSDHPSFGGKGMTNESLKIVEKEGRRVLKFKLPPLSTLIFKRQK